MDSESTNAPIDRLEVRVVPESLYGICVGNLDAKCSMYSHQDPVHGGVMSDSRNTVEGLTRQTHHIAATCASRSDEQILVTAARAHVRTP